MNSEQTPANEDNPTPVTGPFAVHVNQLPSGVELDVSAYLRHVFYGLAEAAENDPEQLIESLVELAEAGRAATGQPSHSLPARERDEAADELIVKFAGEGGIPVYGQQVLRLVERLWHLVRPRSIPQQQNQPGAQGGAAA